MLDWIGKTDWSAPIHLTIAEKGDGVTELLEGIEKHGAFLKQSIHGIKKQKRKLTEEIKDILSRDIAKNVEKAWERQGTDDKIEAILGKELDPYTVAQNILNNIVTNEG